MNIEFKVNRPDNRRGTSRETSDHYEMIVYTCFLSFHQVEYWRTSVFCSSPFVISSNGRWKDSADDVTREKEHDKIIVRKNNILINLNWPFQRVIRSILRLKFINDFTQRIINKASHGFCYFFRKRFVNDDSSKTPHPQHSANVLQVGSSLSERQSSKTFALI